MVLSTEGKILIKALRQKKGCGIRKLIAEFPKAQFTAENWTQPNWLNWTGSFSSVRLSSVQFSAVHWTSDGLRRPTTAVAGSWQWRTCDGRRRSSQLVAGFRPTTDVALIERFTRVCPDYEEPATNTNFVAESLQVVAGSIHSGKLNWTEQFSSVEFSSVSRCALG